MAVWRASDVEISAFAGTTHKMIVLSSLTYLIVVVGEGAVQRELPFGHLASDSLNIFGLVTDRVSSDTRKIDNGKIRRIRGVDCKDNRFIYDVLLATSFLVREFLNSLSDFIEIRELLTLIHLKDAVWIAHYILQLHQKQLTVAYNADCGQDEVLVAFW